MQGAKKRGTGNEKFTHYITQSTKVIKQVKRNIF